MKYVDSSYVPSGQEYRRRKFIWFSKVVHPHVRLEHIVGIPVDNPSKPVGLRDQTLASSFDLNPN